MDETSIIRSTNGSRNVQTNLDFEAIAELTCSTVAHNSQRVYRQTFQSWKDWCLQQDVSPFDLHAKHVVEFLKSRKVTRQTRHVSLSALRKLARILALDYTTPYFRAMYDALLLVKVPTENEGGQERAKHALTAREVWQVLGVWSKQSPLHIRNQAILTLMFFSGLRRSELVNLRWTDIDMEAGILTIRHGKRDKLREIAIVSDQNDTAIVALQSWREIVNSEREFVFCPIIRGGRLGADKPLSPRGLNRMIDYTAELSGVSFTPHDTRRTFATDLLAQGSSVVDVQHQLGHSNPATTLRYGMAADARQRRSRFKTSY